MFTWVPIKEKVTMIPSSREKTRDPQTKLQRYAAAVGDGKSLVFKQQN